MPEVDCVSLGIPGEEGPPCFTLASEGISPKGKVLPGPKEELFTHNKPRVLSSREYQPYSQDVAGKWASPQGTIVMRGLM